MNGKLINLALLRSKFMKDQLLEINKNINKLVKTVKISLAIICFILFLLKAFLKMPCPLI